MSWAIPTFPLPPIMACAGMTVCFTPLLVIDDNFVDLDMRITGWSRLYVPECFC